jgi:hypothetical protein
LLGGGGGGLPSHNNIGEYPVVNSSPATFEPKQLNNRFFMATSWLPHSHQFFTGSFSTAAFEVLRNVVVKTATWQH